MSYLDNAIEIHQGKRVIRVWNGHIVRVVIKPEQRRSCQHDWKFTVNSRGGWRHGCLKCGALCR